MPSPRIQYTKELYKRFGYHASWTPGTPIALGDVGLMVNHQFTRLSNLKDMGIEFEIRPDEKKEDISYHSESGMEITFKAAGHSPPEDSGLDPKKAGVVIAWQKKAGVVFVAKGCTAPSIKDQLELATEIIQRYRAGQWNKQHVVVTELIEVDALTVFVSESANGRVELVAGGKTKEANFVSLADATLGFSCVFSHGISTAVLAQQGATPLFRVSQIKARWMRPATFGIRPIDPLDELLPNQVDPESLEFAMIEPQFEDEDTD